MIPKASKFPLRQQFLAFRRHANQLSTPHLRIFYAPTINAGRESRLTVIVPKKVSKKATTRNLFKRLVYDYLWNQISPLHFDFIVLFKPISLIKGDMAHKLVKAELDQILRSRIT